MSGKRVAYAELYGELRRVLLKEGFAKERAELSARLFADASRDGVPSHGLNRFPGYVDDIRSGVIDASAEPIRTEGFGALERWDGRRGPGNLNAWQSMERAVALARMHGMGCVALKHTNHWMRGGAYGWQAAEAGCVGICWTNTMPNMPPWGSVEPKIGNNPLVLAVPRESGPIVLDTAMSQFSYGALKTHRSRGAALPVKGGYDARGELTDDPGAILESGRLLPIGYWKGSGLSVLLDLIAVLLSGGRSTLDIGEEGGEQRLSQVFLAFDLSALSGREPLREKVERVIDDLHKSLPVEGGGTVRYPGEDTLRRRDDALRNGVPVDPDIWERVLAL